MNRRSFIKKSALSLPITLGGFEVAAAQGNKWDWVRSLDPNNENVLVLVQLNGGNDGLNTFIPLDQYDTLFNVRKNIIIPEMNLLPIQGVDDLRLHPGLEEIQHLFNQEKMGIVQNVGYPNPNKSHFRSTDIWTSASDSDVIENTGWLGRYITHNHPEYPEGYPNETNPDPLAITIDTIVSNTCQGPSVNSSFAVNNLNRFSELSTSGILDNIPDNAYGSELQFIEQSIKQSNQYGKVIETAANKGNNLSQAYPDLKLADQLKIVAKLISGGLKTKIYIVKLGGFDTHDTQVDANNPLTGRHADLMRHLSQSIGAFMDDINLLGLGDRITAMTFSEFGRRIRSNDSYGTDHGEAAPLMVFGNNVNPIIHGENPEIDPQVGQGDSLTMKIDFRSVYASLLMDLFDLPESDARSIVYQDFKYIKLIGKSTLVKPLRTENLKYFTLKQNYPNPVKDSTTIEFSSRGMHILMELYNLDGRKIMTMTDERLPKGNHIQSVDLSDLPKGAYFYQLREGEKTITKKLIKK